MAEQGFYFKESMSVSQFENPAVDIEDLSVNTLLDSEYIKGYLGERNRFVNSLVTENVPIHKTLNYFCPRTLKYEEDNILDVVSS